jgi:hypothetical protein
LNLVSYSHHTFYGRHKSPAYVPEGREVHWGHWPRGPPFKFCLESRVLEFLVTPMQPISVVVHRCEEPE